MNMDGWMDVQRLAYSGEALNYVGVGGRTFRVHIALTDGCGLEDAALCQSFDHVIAVSSRPSIHPSKVYSLFTHIHSCILADTIHDVCMRWIDQSVADLTLTPAWPPQTYKPYLLGWAFQRPQEAHWSSQLFSWKSASFLHASAPRSFLHDV